MKQFSIVILFAVAMHYLFIAAFNSKLPGLHQLALTAAVLIGVVFVLRMMMGVKE